MDESHRVSRKRDIDQKRGIAAIGILFPGVSDVTSVLHEAR